MAASNMNVVVITGNLTRDPELRSTPSGTSVCKLARRGQQPPERRPDRRMGRQAQLLRRDGLGSAGRELRQLPLQGPPGGDRGATRLARVGRDKTPKGTRSPTKPATRSRDSRRSSPTRSSSSARATARAGPTATAASPRAATPQPTPRTSRPPRWGPAAETAETTTFPSRRLRGRRHAASPSSPHGGARASSAVRSVGSGPDGKDQGGTPHRAAGGGRRSVRGRASTRGSTSTRSTTRTSTCCAASSPTRGRRGVAASPGSPASTSASSRWR